MAFGVPFSLGFDAKKTKSKFANTTTANEATNTSGSNTFGGRSTPIAPAGWVSNYNALGKNLGFGAVSQAPRRQSAVPQTPILQQTVDETTGQNVMTPDGVSTAPSQDAADVYRPNTGAGRSVNNLPMENEVFIEPLVDEEFTGPVGGPTGFNRQQQTGVDIITRRAAGPNAGAASLLGGGARANQGARALEQFSNDELIPYLREKGPQLGGESQDVGNISATEGWQGRGNYLDPFLKEVVDTTGADLAEQRDRQANRNKMAAATGGAFGGRGEAVRQAISDDDYARSRGSILGGLRSQGFNQSNAFAMQDADRNLTAAQSNQVAQTANADRRNSRDLATLRASIDTAAGKRQIMQLSSDNAIAAANLGIAEGELGAAADDKEREGAMDLFEAGQIGFEQLMAFLGIGQGLFGEEEEGTGTETAIGSSVSSGTETGTRSGSQIGFSGSLGDR